MNRAATAAGTAPAAPTQPQRRTAVLVVMCIGLFFVQLDVTIVNVALPSIGAELRASTSGLQWVVDAYALVLASLLLLGGSIGDRYGHRRVVMAGLGVFALASAGCALAPNVATVTLARAGQGLGAALLLPGTLAVIVRAYPRRAEQARAVAAWAAVGGLALPAGPLLGGALVEAAGWRWVFAINVPIALAAVAATAMVVRESGDGSDTRIDVTGALLAVAALAALTFTVIEAPSRTARTAVLVAGAATVLLIAAFLVTEARSTKPMLPLDLFRRRDFVAANLAAAVMNLVTLGLLFVLTLYFQQVRHLSPMAAGLTLVPLFGLVALLAPVAGRLTARYGPAPPAIAGLAVGAIGVALLLITKVTTPAYALLPALILLGVGLGTMTTPLVATAMRSVGPERAGLASGVNNTARQTGGAIGIAAFGAVAGSPQAAAQFVAGLHTVALVGAAGFLVTAGGLAAVLRRHASTDTGRDQPAGRRGE